jgi:hypothetical protein
MVEYKVPKGVVVPFLPPMRWVYMTVERAEELLLTNTFNRKPSERYIQQMTNDMADGRFNYLSCVQVIMGADEQLQNGQKTLKAIVRSGQPQWIILIEEVPTETDPWLTMDNTERRTLAQELQREGHANARLCAAITNNLCRYEIGQAIAGRLAPSPAEARRKWNDAREQIDGRTADIVRISQEIGFSSPSALGAVYVLGEDLDPERSVEFFRRLESENYGGRKGDRNPIEQFLRRTHTVHVHREHERRHGADNETDTSWLIKALNAWRTNDERILRHERTQSGRYPKQPRILTGAEVDEILGQTAEDLEALEDDG